MKKSSKRLFAGIALSTLLLAGCGSNETRPANTSQTNTVSNVIEQQAQGASGAAADADAGTNFKPDEKPAFDTVDFDIAGMSADMTYATVNDMMVSPSKYENKTVRIKGPFRHMRSEEFQTDYFAVLIQDATACCSQGFEFVWNDGSHAWPADYPKTDTMVVVTGTFKTYQEGKGTYCHLVDASLQTA